MGTTDLFERLDNRTLPQHWVDDLCQYVADGLARRFLGPSYQTLHGSEVGLTCLCRACDGSHWFALFWFDLMGIWDLADAADWLQAQGSHCDCTLVAQLMARTR